jgi:hypothetical protein
MFVERFFLYCFNIPRWNPRMRPQDSVYLRHNQLLSLRDQLQAKVDFLNKELEAKSRRYKHLLSEYPCVHTFSMASINICSCCMIHYSSHMGHGMHLILNEIAE